MAKKKRAAKIRRSLTRNRARERELAKAKKQVLRYETVEFVEELAVSGKKHDDGFSVTTQSGKEFTAPKLIFATGISDIMPDIKGFSECWGISVVHCPYCHGYELRGQKTGILANADRAFHLAPLLKNLTDDLTIFTSGEESFTADQIKKLKSRHIQILENEITEIEHKGGYIQNVIFKDGGKMLLDGLYASVPFRQHTDIPVELGCELTEQGHIKTDPFQKTTVNGVFACGDNSSMMRSVATAVYTGNMAGAMVNKELSDEQF